MSRIGKMPISIPGGVTVKVDGSRVAVKGPRGELSRTLPAEIANMVEGVTKGYSRQLEIVGVGYKAEVKPYGLLMSLGYSHTIEVRAPEGIKLTAPQPTQVTIEGADKEKVGQVAAEIRLLRPPEPYKGKGVKYVGEHIRRKAGKAAGK
jgi:large subunit ribosomal protein L6